MRKLASLAILVSAVASGSLPSAMCPAVPAWPAPPRFARDIALFEYRDQVSPVRPGGVVAVGSSSIVGWKTMQWDLPGVPVINRGFGGSEISDSVRYVHRIVTKYEPHLIIFFAGTNDLAAGKSPETVARDFQTFVGLVHDRLPNTKILYLSITPAPSRFGIIGKMRTTNSLIRAYCEATPGLTYVDMFNQYLTAAGKPRPELFVKDQLHMNSKGYAIWAETLRPIVR